MQCPNDTLLAAFGKHTLPENQLAALEIHLDTCEHCRKIVSATVGGPAEPQIDRYEIEEVLGSGGMGTVYLAHDRTLDRKVALKLHRVGSGDDRLHREALAMAKLAHPNVVTVFEIGSIDNRLYVAMEYVRGTTLRGWHEAAPRSWRETIAMLVGAGNGLAAAHAAGLVHRDFKPENVLVGEDGRPRVSDFGLARVGMAIEHPRTMGSSLERRLAEGSSPIARPEGSSPATEALGTPRALGAPVGALGTPAPMTVTGVLLGTPGYMAPEQLSGDRVDARSDQFSFCVVAWEYVFGKRPFVGATLAALHEAIMRQALPAIRGDVPRRGRRALERGLSADASLRYATMTELLDELAAASAPRAKRRVVVAASLTCALALGVATSRAGGPECSTGYDRLATVWDNARRLAVNNAIRATRASHAAYVADHVVRELDAYTSQWAAMYVEACEATHVRGEQSQALLDRRMECLDRRRVQLGGLTDLLAHADRTVVDKAGEAVRALPPLEQCADRAALLAVVPPPADPALAARIAEARTRLASAEALRVAGKYREALAQAKPIAELARTLGYRPFEADAVYTLALIQDALGDSKAAEPSLYAALRAAEAGGDNELAAKIWATLVNTIGSRLDRVDEAERLSGLADAAVERAGRPARLEMRLVRTIANLRIKQGRYAEARDLFARGAKLAAAALGPDDPFVARMLDAEGTQLENLGKLEEALARYEQARVIAERAQGPDHPDLAVSYENIGIVNGRLGHYERARADLERAQTIAERAFGTEHRQVAEIIDELGLLEHTHGRADLALPLLRRAHAMAARVLGPEHTTTIDYLGHIGVALRHLRQLDEAWRVASQALELEQKVRGGNHPRLAGKLANLASLALDRDDPRTALSLYQRARDMYAATVGPTHLNVVRVTNGATSALLALGRASEALASARSAVAVAEQARGADDPEVAGALAWVGKAQLALHAPKSAVAPLERALAILDKPGAEPSVLADTQFLLARALVDAGRDRASAITLAKRAHDAYVASPEYGPTSEDAVATQSWLAAHH